MTRRYCALLFFGITTLAGYNQSSFSAETILGIRARLIEKSELLSSDEKTIVISSAQAVGPEIMYDVLFRRLDRDRSDDVSMAEFEATCRNNTRDVFTALDADESRRVDRKEISRYAAIVKSAGC